MKVFSSSDQGLFGSSLFWVLNRLPYFHDKKMYPNWEILNINHGDPNNNNNIVPEIIYPIKLSDLPSKKVNLNTVPTHNFTDFNEANFYFNHFFQFNFEIIQLADNISKNFKNTLGIHFRGNDKTKTNHESICINENQFIKKIEKFTNSNKFDSIFLLSDDIQIKNDIKDLLFEKFECDIFVNDFPTTFHMDQKNMDNRLELTKQSVAEMLALSKCKSVLKSHSAFSSWAKIINPELEMYRVNECKNNWFPDYYLPEL